MLKGGVIGLGRMGITHYAILNPHPDVQFTAACDASKFMLKNFKRYTSLALFDDYPKMLRDADLDFVIVSTPTASHYEIVMAAIERGLHVFVEKPFALHMEEGQKLVDAADRAGTVNQVGYFLHYNCVLNEARRLVQSGTIGDVVHYKSEMYGRTVMKPSKTSWRSKKDQGGGCMLDFASHCLELVDQFFGPVEGVSGSLLKNIYSTHVEDAIYTTLSHTGGATGNVMVSWSDPSFRRPYNRLEVTGTLGKVVTDRQEVRLFLSEADAERGLPAGWSIKYLPELDQGVRFSVRGAEFTEQLDDFVQHILDGNKDTECTFADALRTDQVIEWIRADAATAGSKQ